MSKKQSHCDWADKALISASILEMFQAIDNMASTITLQSNGNSDRNVKSKTLAFIKEIEEFSKNKKTKFCVMRAPKGE